MKSFSRATPSFATFSAISAALRLESVAKEDLGIVAGGLPLSSEIPPESGVLSTENPGRTPVFLALFPCSRVCVPRRLDLPRHRLGVGVSGWVLGRGVG